jgi:two-component system cell cycle sensor histidine kinase/response regulator CckA
MDTYQMAVRQTDSRPTIILVVDDEYRVRALARRSLEPAGYHVIEAGNGFDAIAILDGGAVVDLLMADLDMPALGGEEMVRRIRVARPDVKVLYVTGHIDRLMEERPVLWQGEAFLDKPFTREGLLEAVSLLLFGTLQKPS